MHVKSAFPPLPPLPETNVHHVLFGRPDQADWPEYTLYVEERTGRKRTYKELSKRLALGATALGAPVADGGLGLHGEGDEIVGLVGDNSLDYIEIVHSLLMITTPFALISSYSKRFELVHALKLTKATRLFVDARLLKNVLAALDDPDVHITPDKIYILAGHPPKNRKSFGQLIDAVQRKNAPLQPVRPAKKDTLAYLVMSSGTSGLPKAVMITHGNLICSILQATVGAQAAQPFAPSMKVPVHPITIAFLPFFHSYGLHMHILRATLAPATHIILERWNTVQYLNAVAKYRATHLTLIPSAVHQLVTHPSTKTTDLSSVIMAGSGGAYLPPELAERFTGLLRKGFDIGQGYGLSECTIAALSRPFEGMLNMPAPPPRCTGILIPGMQARTVLPDGSDAPPGVPGELWLRGDNVMAGYWGNAEASAAAFGEAFGEGGWLRTGDNFSVDEGGYFFFADRGKDTLKISGEQVSPKEIEDALFAHPEKLISDVTVAGVSGGGRTEDERVPRAWIVLSGAGKRRGAGEVIRALDGWHREMLSRWKWLRGGIEVVEELPKSPTGKIMRRVLQEDYERRLKKGKAKL